MNYLVSFQAVSCFDNKMAIAISLTLYFTIYHGNVDSNPLIRHFVYKEITERTD